MQVKERNGGRWSESSRGRIKASWVSISWAEASREDSSGCWMAGGRVGIAVQLHGHFCILLASQKQHVHCWEISAFLRMLRWAAAATRLLAETEGKKEVFFLWRSHICWCWWHRALLYGRSLHSSAFLSCKCWSQTYGRAVPFPIGGENALRHFTVYIQSQWSLCLCLTLFHLHKPFVCCDMLSTACTIYTLTVQDSGNGFLIGKLQDLLFFFGSSTTSLMTQAGQRKQQQIVAVHLIT